MLDRLLDLDPELGHRSSGASTVTALEYTVTRVAPRSKSRRASTSGGRPRRSPRATEYDSIAIPVIERLQSKMRTVGDAPARTVTVITWPIRAADYVLSAP